MSDELDLCADITATLDRMNAAAQRDLDDLHRLLRRLGVDPDAPKEKPMRTTPAPKPVTQDVLAVLSRCACEGMTVRLPPEQLDRKLYVAVDEVLRACGGKWNRAKRVHLFAVDPEALLSDVLNTGTIARAADLGWFPTPPAVVAELMARADVRAGMTALEPSAGEGAIALALREAGAVVGCVEIDPRRAETLRSLGFAVTEGDALAFWTPERFDRVVMNPPFAKQADIAHVRHAHAFLATNGLLVSVMGASVAFREDKRTVEFRAWVAEHGGSIEALPDGSFKSSGTGVRTVVVSVPA